MNAGVHQQRTLARRVECTGIGLHGGRPVRVRLGPGRPDEGIVFVRTDQAERRRLKATVDGVVDVDHATTLADTSQPNGASVQTVEHLLAALYVNIVVGLIAWVA